MIYYGTKTHAKVSFECSISVVVHTNANSCRHESLMEHGDQPEKNSHSSALWYTSFVSWRQPGNKINISQHELLCMSVLHVIVRDPIIRKYTSVKRHGWIFSCSCTLDCHSTRRMGMAKKQQHALFSMNWLKTCFQVHRHFPSFPGQKGPKCRARKIGK